MMQSLTLQVTRFANTTINTGKEEPVKQKAAALLTYSQRTDFSSYDLWNDLCKATHEVITAKGFEGKDIVLPDGQRFPLIGLPYDKFLSHVQTDPEEGAGFFVL
eukprot:FR737286.1.p1 GENE.FR737286.1~~FR737286.1.p1  ORF type:complete len:104 (+),score=8.87 FR737286.1:106-417(+)